MRRSLVASSRINPGGQSQVPFLIRFNNIEERERKEEEEEEEEERERERERERESELFEQGREQE